MSVTQRPHYIYRHDLCACYRNLAARVPPPVNHDGVCCLRDGTPPRRERL